MNQQPAENEHKDKMLNVKGDILGKKNFSLEEKKSFCCILFTEWLCFISDIEGW